MAYKWNKDIIKNEIVKISNNNEPLNASYILKNYPNLYFSAKKYFGSWEKTLLELNIDYSKITLKRKERWNKAKVITEIRKLANSGISLKSDYIQKEYTKLHSAAQRYFGSWGIAVEEAGFNYDNIKGIKWNKEKILEEILKLQLENKDLSAKNIQQINMPLFQAACRFFGSWKNALNEVGIDYSIYKKNKEWTEETIKNEIMKIKEKNGFIPPGKLSKVHPSLYQAIKRYYSKPNWEKLFEIS